MNTPSGTTYKAIEEQDAHAEGALRTTGSALPELSSLTEMVRVMIPNREQQEREIALERQLSDREIAEEREQQECKSTWVPEEILTDQGTNFTYKSEFADQVH